MPGNVGIGGSPTTWGSCIAYMPVCGNFLSIAAGESGLGYLNQVLAKMHLYLTCAFCQGPLCTLQTMI